MVKLCSPIACVVRGLNQSSLSLSPFLVLVDLDPLLPISPQVTSHPLRCQLLQSTLLSPLSSHSDQEAAAIGGPFLCASLMVVSPFWKQGREAHWEAPFTYSQDWLL